MIDSLVFLLAGAFLFAAGFAFCYFALVRRTEERGQIIHAVTDADGYNIDPKFGVPVRHGDFVQANSIAEFLKEKEGEELSIGDVIKDDDL